MATSKEHGTPPWAMALVIGCTILIAIGQVMMKLGVQDGFHGIVALLESPFFIIGVIAYVVAGFLMTYALKFGELSTLYPLIALGFVWVGASSYFILHETMTVLQIAGTLCIILGVSVIGHTGRRKPAKLAGKVRA